MTLRASDLQSASDLDSIRNSCDVFKQLLLLPLILLPLPLSITRGSHIDLQLITYAVHFFVGALFCFVLESSQPLPPFVSVCLIMIGSPSNCEACLGAAHAAALRAVW